MGKICATTNDRRNRAIAKQMALYTAMAGAGLGTDDAVAAFVPVAFDTPIVLRDGLLELDLNGDGDTDYVINAHNYLGGVSFDFASHTYQTPGLDNYHDVNLLPPRSAIGPATDDWVTNMVLFETATPSGPLLDVRGWLGLLFDIPGGSTHFGYLDLEGSVGQDPSTALLRIHGGAFESEPDRPIAATAPEPGALALLALGCVGIAAMRTRRAREVLRDESTEARQRARPT